MLEVANNKLCTHFSISDYLTTRHFQYVEEFVCLYTIFECNTVVGKCLGKQRILTV